MRYIKMIRRALALSCLLPIAFSVVAEPSKACGRISSFANPPATQDLHRVTIDRLNDKNVTSKGFYVLEPGIYQVKVYEQINDHRLRAGRNRGTSKTIEVKVEPNKRYHLAAEFIKDKRYSKTNKYWEPVIWKVTDEACELK
ncbi:hypothetical protein ACFSJ3_07730 [Corallincola platygyrae]|uniref:DUF2846 domain-containing protein n=1 Tax=Corallincola platygyrae TaxID=1193278 RepID=A0ABW4XK08_9GAMM